MPKTDFKNTFSWSVSRDGVFKECARKYYFEYYGYWGGWQDDAPTRTREIYILKQLKNRWTWVGQVVHDCIARSLHNLSRSVPVLKLEEILRITRTIMRQDFRQSRSGRYRQNPKVYCGLFEHEYGADVSDSEWKAAAESVDRCLITFYDSDHYAKLRDLKPEDFLEVERFSSFADDGVEVRMKLDCCTRETDRVVVWDWKTGRREADAGLSLQMACYAHYARQAYRVPLERVSARRFDLHRNQLYVDTVTQAELDEILAYVRGSIKDMHGLLDDVAENTATEERFRKIERANICLKCNFLKVCKPDI